jgi:hypothetical protein
MPEPAARESITIYRVTCTGAQRMEECGSGYSLTSWGQDTVAYKGDDDGGETYEMPAGYSVGVDAANVRRIYDARNVEADLIDGGHGPCLLGPNYEQLIPLKRVRL